MSKIPSQFDCQLLAEIVNLAVESIVILDSSGNIRYWNRASESMFGFEESDVLGNSFIELTISPSAQATAEADFLSVEVGDSPVSRIREIEAVRKDRSKFWMESSASILQLNGQKWLLLLIRDIDSRRKRIQALKREALTDPLSQLSNRRGFQSALESNLDCRLALSIVDIDHFKQINDQFGHGIGDEAIVFVATELSKSFPDAINVARLGGDEFGIILESTDDSVTCELFDSFRERLASTPFSSKAMTLTVSIGGAICDSGQCPARDLLTSADKCLYESKLAGRNRSTFKTI